VHRRSFLGAGLALAAPPDPAAGSVVPDGFAHEHLVTGPFPEFVVGFDFLPDGRTLLLEKDTGRILLARPGLSTVVSVFTVPGVNADFAERGLLGVAVDPDWPARPYVYFDLTHVSGVTRVVMYEVQGDLVDPQSTALSFVNPFLLITDIPDLWEIHNAGTLRFGPDGMLYVATGDDARACQAQSLTAPEGKMLRLDVSAMPGAGPGPPRTEDLDPGDNPWSGGTGYQPLVYAWGERNPFRFTIDAPTGDVFIGNVGSHLYEEIDFIPGSGYLGSNFGWPQFEGPAPIFCCGTCGQGNPFTAAIHVIPHPAKGFVTVIGGPVMRHVPSEPTSFPTAYDGDYFYFMFYQGTIHRLRETGGTWDFAPPVAGQPDAETWGAGFPGVSDARLGADGALWFLSMGTEPALPAGLHRIRFDGPAVDAGVAAMPASPLRAVPNPVVAGRPVRFELDDRRSGAVRLLFYDAAGRLVRTVAGTLAWDGRTASGRPAAAGVYAVEAEVDGRVAGRTKVTLVP
jgi:hypothetical protein